MNYLSKPIRFLLGSILAWLLFLSLLRLIFLGIFRNPDEEIPFSILVKSLYLGVKYDMRLILMLHLPVFGLGWVRGIHILQSARGRRLWVIYLTLCWAVVLLFYAVDFGYYGYFEARLEATILMYLYNPLICLEMVVESYPVFWGATIFCLLVLGYALSTRWWILRLASAETRAGKWKKVALVALCILLYAFGIYGKFSFYPLRWSDAFFSSHSFASYLALNPVLFFIETMKNRDISYDEEQTRKYYDTMIAYLGVDRPDPKNLSFIRIAKGKNGERPNVVLVLLESFAYFKTGVSGNPLNPSPNFDSLARQGILFTRFYTPHAGTARSVFTATIGIPDIELIKTSSRNPLVVKQHTIINAFEGYDKYYFLGGSANWGEIRGLLCHNIPGLKVFEEGSYSSPREDVWGISDLSLFKEANQVLRQKRERPFFAIIHTAGNHKPYTIPKDNDGFQRLTNDEDEVVKYGFKSVDAYNSFRFMDHSVGVFMNLARKEDYFKHTIFAFFGDHGLVRQCSHMPKSEEQLGLNHHHVPFLLYAPSLISEGRTYDKVASEVDMLPTIAGLAGIPYLNSSLGIDLLDPSLDRQHYAFTIQHNRGPELGLIGDQYYFLICADGSNRRLYRIYGDTPKENAIAQFPDIALEMEKICLGIYETARYVRSHNSSERVASLLKEKQK